jgi:hypothetical protein
MHKTTFEADLALTIECLAKSVAALEAQASALGDTILAWQFKRNEFVRVTVEAALPAINRKVLASLRAKYPGFVESSVEDTFRHIKIWLWVFKSKHYEPALAKLKVRLSYHISSSGEIPEIERIDNEIFSLSEKQHQVETRLASVHAVLAKLTDAQVKGAKLPEETKQEVRDMAQRARGYQQKEAERRQSGYQQQYQREVQHVTVVNEVESDDDLWLYYLTEIPTSMRTFAIDSMVDHRRHEIYVDAWAQPASDPAPVQDNGCAPLDPATNDSPGACSPNADANNDFTAAVAVEAAVASQADAIATDDSLGAFS